MDRVTAGRLSIAAVLHRFIEDEALPGSGVTSETFWRTAEELFDGFGPRIRELLQRRLTLQEQIDGYHRGHPGQPDASHYRAFLEQIGYLQPAPGSFTISTTGVDREISEQAGPQLVVPLLNARFATNAANARWGSLYDALYGTDVIAEDGPLARGDGYNAARGAAVVARARLFLDATAPLTAGSHANATAYAVQGAALSITLEGGAVVGLADPATFAGWTGAADAPSAILLVHHGLHAEIRVDRTDPVGAADPAGICDLILESAVTTIMDLEDSVAAVDADDKTLGYRNWLLLNRGALSATVTKNGTTFLRTMQDDRVYSAPAGGEVVLPGRSLLFIRQVGHLMTTDAVLDADGAEVSEGVLDALVTTLGSLHDLRGAWPRKNSRAGAIYVVKPKQHGPDEVQLTVDLFARIESAFGLPENTIKLGIMDEERRTTVNLRACIEVARRRVAFINTGFLDRTGDEIHTSLLAGPMARKADLRNERFMAAYEDSNVDVGLEAGFPHRAQIGKGMWAMPDRMAAMLEQKITHPRAGATTAWVPSPTAATLHALHYHQIDVFAVQRELAKQPATGLEPILTIPLAEPDWTAAEIREELDTNVQSILGYVVRWIDQGIGCSTVPNLRDVGLMEDRATLRISSQLLANWLQHGVITREQVLESLHRIAGVVDGQNSGDPVYRNLVQPGESGIAFNAARDLILQGAAQPNGYTEPILHRARRQKKAQQVGAGQMP